MIFTYCLIDKTAAELDFSAGKITQPLLIIIIRGDGNNSTAAIFRQYGNYFADFWIFLRWKVDAHLTFGGILELKKCVTRPLYLQYTYEATYCYYSYNRKWFGLILPSRITGSSTAHC